MAKIKTLLAKDPDFRIHDGISTVPRASFQLGRDCPPQYKTVIMECIAREWLMPVAHMKESEYVWEKVAS